VAAPSDAAKGVVGRAEELTHVSHLLAKTGTSSRVELAGLVHRIGDERNRID
jgi:hypothetical protein